MKPPEWRLLYAQSSYHWYHWARRELPSRILLSKGYEVHGLIRRASTFNTGRVDHLYVDPHDPSARFFFALRRPGQRRANDPLIYDIQPHEIYHLGAQSHVRVSFDMPGIYRRRDGLRDYASPPGDPSQRHSHEILSGLQ